MLAFLQKLAIVFLVGGSLCFAQSEGQAADPAVPALPQQTPDTQAPAFTFTAITRMIVVEVVARDSEDNPVRNLTAKDLLVSEKIGDSDSKDLPEKIASFNAVNETADRTGNSQGIVLRWLHKSFCPLAGDPAGTRYAHHSGFVFPGSANGSCTGSTSQVARTKMAIVRYQRFP